MTCTITSDGSEARLPFRNEHEPPYPAIKRELLNTISLLCGGGYTDFYVNCEYGVPLWAAEMVCLLKRKIPVRLHIAVPYEEQCRDWPEEFRDRYYRIHQYADSVTLIRTRYCTDCYAAADAHMTDRSDLVLVFGTPSDRMDIVRYAEKNGTIVEFAQI